MILRHLKIVSIVMKMSTIAWVSGCALEDQFLTITPSDKAPQIGLAPGFALPNSVYKSSEADSSYLLAKKRTKKIFNLLIESLSDQGVAGSITLIFLNGGYESFPYSSKKAVYIPITFLENVSLSANFREGKKSTSTLRIDSEIFEQVVAFSVAHELAHILSEESSGSYTFSARLTCEISVNCTNGGLKAFERRMDLLAFEILKVAGFNVDEDVYQKLLDVMRLGSRKRFLALFPTMLAVELLRGMRDEDEAELLKIKYRTRDQKVELIWEFFVIYRSIVNRIIHVCGRISVLAGRSDGILHEPQEPIKIISSGVEKMLVLEPNSAIKMYNECLSHETRVLSERIRILYETFLKDYGSAMELKAILDEIEHQEIRYFGGEITQFWTSYRDFFYSERRPGLLFSWIKFTGKDNFPGGTWKAHRNFQGEVLQELNEAIEKLPSEDSENLLAGSVGESFQSRFLRYIYRVNVVPEISERYYFLDGI